MRMWNVDPKLMCRQHLLGEHAECHMFVGSIFKGYDLSTYASLGFLNAEQLSARHDALAEEMDNRGYSHCSPLSEFISPSDLNGRISSDANLEELAHRCPECRERQQEAANVRRYPSKTG